MNNIKHMLQDITSCVVINAIRVKEVSSDEHAFHVKEITNDETDVPYINVIMTNSK